MTETYQVDDVFTPTKPARFTFVERDKVNDKLVAALKTPGKQIVVYGPSGSGKTTLVLNKLHQLYEDQIITRCFSALTFEQIVLNAFDALAYFYAAERSTSNKRTISASIQSEYLGIKGLLGANSSEENQTKQVRVLPPQLTAQNLARFLGEAKCCWVLEDFHKIDHREKRKLAQVMKLFMDMSDSYKDLKIIAIGAVDTAREVIEYDPEMRNRVSEVFVPLMTEEELEEIPLKGEQLINFSLLPDVKHQIVQFSDGLAAVCHQLCLNICFSANINQTLNQKVHIGSAHFERALKQYVEESSDTLKAAFDKAFREIRQVKGERYNDGKLIIEALLEFSQEGAASSDILTSIRRRYANYSNITKFLRQLLTPYRGALIRFDDASGRYSFSESLYRVYASTYFEIERQKQRTTRGDVKVNDQLLLRQVFKLLDELSKSQ